MIRISNIKYSPLLSEENIPEFVAKKYKIDKIYDFRIVKQSIDARNKADVHYVYTVDIATNNERKLVQRYKNISLYKHNSYSLPKCDGGGKKVVVAGFGPAGIMCAYALQKSGYNVTVLERGEMVDDRLTSVNKMKNEGILNTESNIQFGEGGAGTFSDGKLTTGVNDLRISYVLDEFAKHGAPNEILYRAKPHIGTDNLIKMVKSFREDIINSGGDIKFCHKLKGITIHDGKIQSVTVQNKSREYTIDTDILVIATGHSARDTFSMLKDAGLSMERKVFSVGVRVEHKQDKISLAQYGQMYKFLPPADYKLSTKTSNGRSVYTFCMCPGGQVIASASEEGGVVTNGMSYFSRDGENANSALLVNVMPSDLEGDDVLEGCKFQRNLEERAYKISNSFFAPYQTVGDFIYNDDSPATVTPSYLPGVIKYDLKKLLPDFVWEALVEAIPIFDKKLKGFADKGAVLIGPETRSSSPVRVLRDERTYMSNIKGIYPCGEGAGYAGGIMTAAVDGIKVAEAIMKRG